MKHKHLFKRLVILGIVSCLCLLSVQTSAGIQRDTAQTIKPIESPTLQHHARTLEDTSLTLQQVPNLYTTPMIGEDVYVYSDAYPTQNPTIASNGNDVLVVSENPIDVSSTDIVLAASSDGGATFDVEATFTGEGVVSKPVIDYCQTSDFEGYGTVLPDYQNAELWLMHFPSLTDPEVVWGDSNGWTVWSITLDNYDYYSIDVAGYPHGTQAPAPEFHGVITLIGYGSYGQQLENFYETEDSSIGACYLAFDGNLGDTVTVDIDLTTQTYYEAMELSDEPDFLIDGVFLESCWVEPENENWWENDWPTYSFEGAHNPDLVADGGYCYMVCELDGDVVCYYKESGSETFQESTITSGGTYPVVTLAGDTVICSYNKGGDIYTSTSDDGGLTWEEDGPINDYAQGAIEESHALDVNNEYVAWTDDRFESRSVHLDKVGAVAYPIIEVSELAGGFGVSALVSNIGTADATDVDWSITFDGGVFFGQETTDTLPTLAVGNSETISTGIVLGLGKTTVTVTAGSATETGDATVLLFFILGL